MAYNRLPDATNTGEPPRQRAGCSRGNVLLIALLLGIFLVIAAYQGLMWYIERDIRKSMSATDYAEYKAWQKTLVPPFTESELNFASTPSTLEKDRTALIKSFQAALSTPARDLLADSRSTVTQALLHNVPLTTQDRDVLYAAAADIDHLLKEAKALAAKPDYLYNSRFIEDEQSFHLLTRPVFQIGAFAAIHQNDRDKALDVIETGLAFYRTEEIADDFYHITAYNAGWQGAATLLVLAQHTSDTATLQRALTILNENRRPIFHRGTDKQMLGTIYLRWREMGKSGYVVHHPDGIPMSQLVRTASNLHGYVKWLKSQGNHSTASPLVKLSDREIEVLNMRHYSPYHSNLSFVAHRILCTPQFRILHQIAAEFAAIIHEHSWWAGAQYNRSIWRNTLSGYDLTRLWLARRIAELRGEALPVTESDFVPRYLPDWPADPYSTAGDAFLFDAARGEFYSIGEDGTLGTADDVYLEIPTGAATDDTTTTATTTTTTTTEERHAE